MLLKGISTPPKPNAKWAVFQKTRKMTLPVNRVFSRAQKFFTIGSCFAEEIRKALVAQNVVCLPEYSRIKVDPNRMRIDTLPAREHMNYYNTFSIRQEFERVAGLWQQEEGDFWTLPNRAIDNAMVVRGDGQVFQDPYRRLVFGSCEADLWDAIQQVNEAFTAGVRAADVFVITLGMTEVFRKLSDGRVANQIPVYAGGGGLAETEFHNSDYLENLRNMEVTLSLIREINPEAQIVLSVSPVPLERTFSGEDVFVANMQSKSTLRAVAGAIVRRYDFVHYFPGYEIVSGIGAAAYDERDMVHIKPEIVEVIVAAFVNTHFEAVLADQEAQP